MDDGKGKPGRGKDPNAGGLRAPAKGESSSSEFPLNNNDGATFIEPPRKTPAPKQPSAQKPPAAKQPSAPKQPSTPKQPSSPKPPADDGATFIPQEGNPAGTYVQSGSGPRSGAASYREIVLQTGDMLGGRYEILQLLGEGGMGAVYKASDREVDRFVALKLIRPELASNPAILARFKQELLTAHQVTHKNVIRIYDISEADGVKFITMEFVEGDDLRKILIDGGKLPPDQAVEMIRQVCLALDAAHTVGIIHRDLKPQNIMRDKQGRILVMDFGLARSLDSEAGMTQTGALLGTIEYMSPEQSMGKPLDQRSDLFAVGLIFYELLTGKMPYKAETAMASLLRRNQERAIPAAELDASIPTGLSDIVSKCLERELDKRYQSAAEILADLDAWQGKRPVMASMVTNTIVVGQRQWPWKWIITGALAVVATGGIWLYVDKSPRVETGAKAGPVVPDVSLAILPFHNATSDASMDWLGSSLSEMLSTDVGQSAHMRMVSPDRLHQIYADLRLTPTSNLDPDTLRRIAEFSNADTVVYGQYAKFGDQIRIDATLQDRKRNRTEPLKIEAASEKDIPGTVDKLAELIRSHLSLSSDVLKELKASSFQPSSKSAPALRDYNQAAQLLRDGKNIEAVKALESSVQEDPQFALAYSRLAEANAALGYDTQAETDSRKALELSAQLPLAEKYVIEANHARIMKDNKKAIEAYENLAKTFPDNADVEYTLGTLYMDKGDYEKARGEFAKVLQADPKNVKALWQMGVVDINKDNPQAALDPLNKGLSLAIQVDNQEQKALLLHAIGVAYRGMNKPDEAMRNYKESMEINKRIGVKRALAANYVEMGVVQNSLGKPDDALASFTQALNLQREIGIKKEMGFTLIDIASVYQDRGQYDKALQNLKESLQIQRDTGDEENQALCLNDIGSVYLSRGDSDNALTYFQQALQLREKRNDPSGTADVLHGLGTTYASMGQYDQALTTFVKAIELWRKAGDTRGAAYESHQMGLVFQYQGRYGAAVSAMQDAVKSLHEVNDRSRDTAETLYDLADTLAKAGRGSEAAQPLEEAQSIARELKNDSLQASILNTQGDVQYYRGDFAAAKPLYEQAVKAATRGSEQKMVLISKLNLARLAAAQGHSAAAINDLRSLSQQADSQGLKSIAVSSAVDFAAAMISNRDYAGAKQELNRQLTNSEKLGLRVETARIHYLNGLLSKQAGDAGEAASQFKQTLAILDDVKKEAGAEKILTRPDLKLIYEQATQGSGAAKS